MILFRRQNKSGKSSAESEGSPDEVLNLEFGINICLYYHSQLLQNNKIYWVQFKVGGNGRKKPGVLTDNLQRQRFFLSLSSFQFHTFSFTTGCCPTLLRERRRSQLQISGRSERGSWKVPKTSPSTISVHNACRLERCLTCLFCILFTQRVCPNLYFWSLKSVKYVCSSYFSFHCSLLWCP